MPHQITEDDIERTRALAKIATGKWKPGLICLDDVLGDGLVGLVRASQRFDESLGKHFWAYATPYVRGYILDGFRRRFGEKRQKLAIARADSLSITKDEDPDHEPIEIISEDKTDSSGIGLVNAINNLDLTPDQKRIMRLLAAGYTQTDIARIKNVHPNSVSNNVRLIRSRITKDELVRAIGI